MAEHEEQPYEGNGNGGDPAPASAYAEYPAPEGSPPAAAAKPTGFSDGATDGGRSQVRASRICRGGIRPMFWDGGRFGFGIVSWVGCKGISSGCLRFRDLGGLLCLQCYALQIDGTIRLLG